MLPAVLAVLMQWLAMPRELAWQNDTNLYLGGAASLANGLGYRIEPYLHLPSAGTYPPLTSLGFAVFWWAAGGFPQNAPWLIFGSCLVSFSACGLLSAILRRCDLPYWFASLSVLLFGTSVVWFDLTALLFSEVPFAALMFALCRWTAASGWRRFAPALWWLGIGVLSALLLLTRTAGIVVVIVAAVAWALDPTQRKPRIALPLFAPILVSLLLAQWTQGGAPGYWSYFKSRLISEGSFSNYLIFVLGNAWDYLSGRCWVEGLFNIPDRLAQAKTLGGFGLGPLVHALAFVFGLVLSGLAVTGAWLRRREPLTRLGLWGLLIYFLLLCCWPFRLGTRAALPWLPLVLLWWWSACNALPLPLRRRSLAGVVLAVFLALNVVGNVEVTRREGRRLATEFAQDSAALQAAAAWLRAHAAPDALVAAGRDIPLAHFRHYLGRRLLANAIPEIHAGEFYDVVPAHQGNRRATYALLRGLPPRGRSLTPIGSFGPFTLCAVAPR